MRSTSVSQRKIPLTDKLYYFERKTVERLVIRAGSQEEAERLLDTPEYRDRWVYLDGNHPELVDVEGL
jgi:hypothetical protein